MQSQTISTNHSQPAKAAFLRRTLQGNALFSLLSGLTFIFAAGPVARFIGPNISSTIVLLVGLGLLPFGFIVYRIAANNLRHARTITLLDISWVLGSFLLLGLAWSSFSTAGRWFIGLQAEAVATFAVLQIIGLRRLQK